MARCRLDDQDKAALHKLDDEFTISADNEVAKVVGEMEVEIIRLTSDDGARFRLTIKFPNGEELEVRIARAQLLEQLDIETDES